MEDTKQVIVMRKFPSLRKGKYISQGSHASLGVFTKLFSTKPNQGLLGPDVHVRLGISFAADEWLNNSFKKIVVYVNTEEELLNLEKLANELGIVNCLIQDNGATEFNGVPTYTCIAIGPDYSEKIDKLTAHLPLF